MHVATDDVRRQLAVLTGDIGVRLAGSAGERRAADYIAAQFEARGAAVTVEAFPVRERAVESESLEIRIGGAWHGFPCSLLSNAPGTGGEAVEAPLAVIDAATGYQRDDLSRLTGRAVLHLGSHIETVDDYRRLMAARPAFLLFVDVRYPAGAVTADGLFPAYVHAHGAVPTVSVAYQDAWDWCAGGAAAARLRVAGGMRDSESQNVVGDLPGTDPGAGVIFVGAHHDTQADSVGADDNGTGVAALILLAGALGQTRRRRTIRLVSFGAEEQLSVGSAQYVRRHRTEIAARGRFMFNFDAFGSVLGWSYLVCSGPEGVPEPFVRQFRSVDEYVSVVRDLIPYADHFPFVAAGLPAAWLGRNNCTAGRFFHHRPDDDLSRVSCDLVARMTGTAGRAIAELADAEPWPFAGGDEAEGRRAAVGAMWNDLFGGWDGFGRAGMAPGRF
jgi:Iap family predicted aminopeptidase